MRLLTLIAAAVVSLAVGAIDDPPTRSEVDISLVRLLKSNKDRDALALVESYLTAHPSDAQILFDGARICSRMGDGRQAAGYAIRSLRAGWSDLAAMETHPDLANLRQHEGWQQVLAAMTAVRESQSPPAQPDALSGERQAQPSDDAIGGGLKGASIARRELQQWMHRFGGGKYRVEANEKLNLLIATSLERNSLDRALAMLERLCAVLQQTLFGSPPSQAVLLVIPSEGDAAEFFGSPQHAGEYDHPHRRLVSRDTGASLRHEFTHLIHYGDMERRQQHHPIWVIEGLGALFEEWSTGPGGELVVRPNMRTNEAHDLVRRGKAMPWAEFIRLDHAAFMSAPEAHYAQARSMFAFVAQRGNLGSFYRAFVGGFDAESTGQRALEAVFGAPIGRIDEEWKEWVVESGAMDLRVDPGDGVMGVSISDAGDGVKVDSVQLGSPAQAAGIRPGDVIVEISGAQIRSVGDYLIQTARRNAGEKVAIRYRRADVYSIVELSLASGHE